VRATYLALAAAEPDRYRILDGSGSVDQTDQAIRELVAPLLDR
jgi:thymidylate kinase